MTKKLLVGLGIVSLVALLTASTTINGARSILGLLDASSATHTLPFKVVANTGALPATCTAGEMAVVTAATLGQQIYQCSAGNIWTQQLNSGSSSGGGISVYSAVGLTLTANTYYFPIGGGGTPSTTETNVDVDSPSAATVTNLYVQLSVALGVGNTGVFTMRKNAASQSVTCTISGAATTSCSDTTHSFAVSQGDLLTVQLVTTGTIVVTPNVMFAFQFGNITATGSVNSGTINQIAFYAANGTAVSGETSIPCTASGSGICLIQEQTPSGTGTVTFNSITAIYRDLQIRVRGASSVAATAAEITLRFNNDSGANYTWGLTSSANATSGSQSQVAQTSCEVGTIPGSTGPANAGSGARWDILDYRGTTFQKFGLGNGGVRVGAAQGDVFTQSLTCFWLNTAAITRVDVILSSGNFVAGSVVSLYGVN